MSTTADPKPPQIRVEHIKKSYAHNLVLDDVSLAVNPGEVVALIGPSGAGKSTFLRSINLLEVPDEGRIHVGGIDIDCSRHIHRGELMELRRIAGMVFQSFNLFPHLTVLENICLAQRTVLNRSKASAIDRAMDLLERVGLSQKRDEYPGRLSGGQQQRIAIARALSLDPQIMLFDEPTSALDPELAQEVLKVMRGLAESGMTMIVVTHEMSFAADVAERVVVMADGRIIEQGPPASVMKNPDNERTRQFLRAVLDR